MNIIDASFWFLVALGIYAGIAVARDALNRPKHSTQAFTHDDERCKALARKQDEARKWMEERGIQTLLKGKPGWRRIVPMGEAPKADKVTPIYKGRR